jgi:outer membrane receptor for ferrienterochelin and colicins
LSVSCVGYLPFQTNISINKNQVNILAKLQFDTTIIEEVVISGTMKPVSKLSSPIAVEVYSPAFFRKNPSPNIFESLQMVNGVQPQLNCNVCNTGDIHINGMEGPYTMILIDGMPIVSGLSTVYGLAGIPNNIVKRIEIVKGPASTLYGSEAVGGLINIITKDASTTKGLNIDFSATNIGEYNADISIAKKVKNASTLLGINYFNFQQRRDINDDCFTDLALQQKLSVFNKWNFMLKKNKSASIAARYITENRWGGQMQWKPAFSGGDSVYGETIKTNRLELLATAAVSSQLNIDLSYNYHLQDSYYGTVKYYANQQVAFVQLRWNKTIRQHELLAGIPIRYTLYDDNSPGTATIGGINKPSEILLPGIFIQDVMKLNKQSSVLTGIRYDYNNLHGNIFTPRLSFKYTPDTDHTLRLSVGNGYRVVNLFTEDHAALSGAREVVIAAALKPEQSWNGNINYTGLLKHSNGFINIDASAFFTYFTNKIVGDFITDPNKIIYNNLGGYAVSKGVTVNTDFNFTNGLKIMAGATLMDVYQVTDNYFGKKTKIPQLFAPAFSGTFTVSYHWPKPRLDIDFTGRVNGPMHLPVVPNDYRQATSPLYSILNILITKKIASGVELYVGIKNLLNFIPANPLLHADDPFNKAGGKYFDENGTNRPGSNPYNYTFDPSYNYAAVQGTKFYTGIRWQFK